MPPPARIGRALGWVGVVAPMVVLAGGAVTGAFGWMFDNFVPVTSIVAMGLGLSAALGFREQYRNRVLWILTAASMLMTAELVAYLIAAVTLPDHLVSAALLEVAPRDLPTVAAWALWVSNSTWLPGLALFLTLGMLWFPNGRPPSGGWWIAAPVALSGIALATLGFTLATRPGGSVAYGTATASPPGIAGTVLVPGMVLIGLAMLAAVASMFHRARRARGDERQQVKWVGLGVGFLVVAFVPGLVAQFLGHGYGYALAGSLVGAPVAMTGYLVALVRFRLYDVDVVVSRALVYAALAAFISAVYAAVVVGIGQLIGRDVSGDSQLLLSVAATAIVAVAFEPVRSRLQRSANRLVFGRRATPYEVLSELTRRLGEVESTGAALPRLAQLLAAGTGADRATVWLEVGGNLRPVAVAPDDRAAPMDPEATDLAVPVLQSGRTLGQLTIDKPRGDMVTPADRRLVEDAAGGAALLLQHGRLNARLTERAAELRASRRRLVETQDETRRRLERDLHDGAQQEVVALKLKLGLARTLAVNEGLDVVARELATIGEAVQDAVDSLRTLARGIYPPLLESEGLAPAVQAAARSLPVRVEVEADGLGRYEAQVEACLYFFALETLRMAAQAPTGHVRLTITERADELAARVTTADFEAGSATGRLDLAAPPATLEFARDRIEALGGSLHVARQDSGVIDVEAVLPVADRDALAPSSAAG